MCYAAFYIQKRQPVNVLPRDVEDAETNMPQSAGTDEFQSSQR
jgi:hypothetical protein